MVNIVFYEKPGCATNARQKARLVGAGHALTVRDLLRENWTVEHLRAFFADMPVAQWFNPAAPAVKSGAVDPIACDAAAALELMLRDPLLIRRPLLECESRRMAGFDETRLAILLGAPLATDGDVEGCSHPETPCPAPAARAAGS